LLDLGAMASRLRLQPQELRAEAEAGTLPHVRVGRRGLLFDAERVITELEARAERGIAPREEARRATR
jgi:hypothetical protein